MSFLSKVTELPEEVFQECVSVTLAAGCTTREEMVYMNLFVYGLGYSIAVACVLLLIAGIVLGVKDYIHKVIDTKLGNK
jgi:hypothetical protein